MPTTADPSTVAEAIAAIRRRRACIRRPFWDAVELVAHLKVRRACERAIGE